MFERPEGVRGTRVGDLWNRFVRGEGVRLNDELRLLPRCAAGDELTFLPSHLAGDDGGGVGGCPSSS